MSSTVSINEFLSMSTKDFLKVTMNDAEFIDLCKDSSYSSYQINHPLNVNCLAMKYFLEKIKCSTKRAELFDILFPKIKENFNKACDLYFQSTNNDERASEMALLITTAIATICNAVDKAFSESIFMDTLRSMAIGVLELLKQIYTFLYKRNTMYQEREISSGHHTSIMQSNANFNVLRCKIIGILTSNDVNYFPDQLTIIDVKFFNQLVVILCELAELASIRCSPKVLAEVWKCVVCLCNEKVINSIDRLAIDNFGLDNMEYLSVAVRTLCSCINGCIKDYFEPKIDQSEKSIQLHHKAIKFLITMLQRLASSYPPENFRGHEHVLQMLLITMRTANQKVQPYDETYYQNIISGLRDVVFLIYKSNAFVQCFYNVQSDQFSTEMICLGLEMLKKTLKNNDRGNLQFFVHGNVNMVSKILQCMSIVTVFRENALYNDLVVNLANALIMSSNSNINGNPAVRFLAKSFLENNNILVGYLLTDVWCLWATFLPELQCYNLVIFWSNINDKFSIVQPIHLQSIRVKVLLQNLYDLLSDANKRLLFVDKPIKENIKLWTTLALEGISGDTKNQIMNMETDIETLYNTFLKERTERALYALIGYLQLSSTKSQIKENRLPADYLMKLWKLHFNQQTNSYSSLIVALLRKSISFKRHLNNHQRYQILQVLTTITDTPNLNGFVKIEILNYLRNISVEYFTVEYRNEILRTICHLFTKALLDSDPIIGQLAFRVFSDVTSLEHQNNEVIINDCLKDNESLKNEFRNFVLNDESFATLSNEDMTFLLQLESYSYQHKCIETPIETKLCIDDVTFDISDEREGRIREIIKRMLNDANELIELSKIHSFPRECQQHIAKLTEDLSHLK